MNVRPDLARHLHGRLAAFAEGFRHNLALIGPPGSGKTYQLEQLSVRAPQRLLVISCPLYRESCRSFLQRFLAAILHTGLDGSGAGQRSTEPGTHCEALLARAEPTLPKTVAAIPAIETLIGRRLYGEAFSRSLDLVPAVSEDRGRPCVLMLDEFVLLETLGLVHGFHELGKRVMTWPATLFVLSSSSPVRARTILRERLQLLFGQFELIELGAVDEATAATWALRELRGLRGVRQVTPFLVRWLGAYPRYLSAVLTRLREVALLRRQPEVTDELVSQVAWELLGSPEGLLHQACVARVEQLSSLRQGPRALDVLIAVAEGARTATALGERLGRAGISDALQLLVEQDLIERRGACWLVPDPILRCWLTSIAAAKQRGVAHGAPALRPVFERDLRALWMQWLELRDLPFPEHVMRLLRCFRDDTVALDCKTGRLPRFEQVTPVPGPAGLQATVVVAESQGRRWCCAVQETAMDEGAISQFDAFCRQQSPRPTRKVLVTRAQLPEDARVVAKAKDMWVWNAQEVDVLTTLYGTA